MNYDQLKVVWDSQDDEPMFLIDHDTLNASVKREGRAVAELVSAGEIAIIAVALATAVILPLDAWREGDGLHQYLVAAICLAVGVYAWVNRRQRLAREIDYDQSMLSTVEKAIAQLKYHERALKIMLWSFHLPIAITAGIGLTLYTDTRIPVLWGGLILVCALAWWGTRRDIRKCIRPKRTNLESLRTKLLTPNT
ncbi:MAG: hypothetical protein AAF591_18335 [Verrucomicrobiota bacterium]